MFNGRCCLLVSFSKNSALSFLCKLAFLAGKNCHYFNRQKKMQKRKGHLSRVFIKPTLPDGFLGPFCLCKNQAPLLGNSHKFIYTKFWTLAKSAWRVFFQLNATTSTSNKEYWDRSSALKGFRRQNSFFPAASVPTCCLRIQSTLKETEQYSDR